MNADARRPQRILALAIVVDGAPPHAPPAPPEGWTHRVGQLVVVCLRCAPADPAVRVAELVDVDDYAICHTCRRLLAPQLRN